MILVNSRVDEKIAKEFRDSIYKRTGLRKGDFSESIEEAMLDYIVKYSKSKKTKEFAKRAKIKSR